MSESPNISIYLNRHAFYHALVGVTYVQKCFILFRSFSATKEIETLITALFINMRTLKFKSCLPQLRFSLPSIIITITSNETWNTETHKTDWNPPITNHKPWPFEPVKVKFCFLRGPLRWLTAAKNAIVSWLLNFRIGMFVKSALSVMLSIIFTYGCICHTSCYWCRQIRSYCWYSIGPPSYRETVLSVLENAFLCKTILRVSSPGHSGGEAGKGRRAIATMSLEFKFHL